MMTNMLIPKSTTGKDVDLKATKELANVDEAIATFDRAVERLMTPSQWHELCGKFSANFELAGENLEICNRKIVEGDYIRIDIPGPGPRSGDGYDWVKISMVQKTDNSDKGKLVGIKLVPSNPGQPGKAAAHFFDRMSSSTLLIRQKDNVVTAAYYGRNEIINNHTDSLKDDLRNTAIGLGAMAGLSELQWSKLIHAFLEP